SRYHGDDAPARPCFAVHPLPSVDDDGPGPDPTSRHGPSHTSPTSARRPGRADVGATRGPPGPGPRREDEDEPGAEPGTGRDRARAAGAPQPGRGRGPRAVEPPDRRPHAGPPV